MSHKAFLGIILALLSIGMLRLTFNIQPVKASGTIYIRADRSVNPDTAPISSVDNVTYTFTDNIYDEIVVQRSSIIIDGNGYTLQGSGSGNGFSLTSTLNVTIKRTKIMGFDCGIHSSSHSWSLAISGNNLANNGYGIWFECSFGNTIFENNVTNNTYGIWLWESCCYNTISGNNITQNSQYGIVLGWDSFLEYFENIDNTISGNHITNNGVGIGLTDLANSNTVSGNSIANNGFGVSLSVVSSYNTISGNNITNNGYGIWLWATDSNSISQNEITENTQGIFFEFSSDNTVYHNNFVNNTEQVTSLDSTNIFDDGYPSGGNYWSDYTGIDLYSGPNQDQPGSDGIWDSPYVIDVNNQDNYPFVNPWFLDLIPPVADAGPDQIVHEDTPVILNGEASSDNVGIISYVWTFIDVTPQTLTGVNPTYTFQTPGIYTVTLEVSDAAGNHATDTVTITVLSLNPEESIQRLMETIESWNLEKGTESSLVSKLEETIHLLEKGNEDGAIHKLMDFIDQAEGLRGKKLTDEQADYLIAEAQRIIDLIEG